MTPMIVDLPLQAGKKSNDPVKVLIVDDSAFVRFSVSKQLNEHPEIAVVGVANHGRDALRAIPELQPDVVILDVEMPHMDGLTALRRIMADFPRPVIMFSSRTREGASETIQALMAGAVDFITKPDNRADISGVMKEMTCKILSAARAKVRSVAPRRSPDSAPRRANRPEGMIRPYQGTTPVVLIGSSTGGPGALNEIVPALPADFPSPVLIVQHMPAGFTRSLSERLDSFSSLRVREAKHNDPLMVGQALIAPGGFHMTVDENDRIALNRNATVHGVRPAVDVTLTSLVQRFGGNVVAAILTGMGSDGRYGAFLLRSDGGYVIAEHESTCVVWGMPRSVVEAGAANAILPRPQIAPAIEEAVRTLTNRRVPSKG